eukprot:12212634-Alexandrium_andersonii.AAC.1
MAKLIFAQDFAGLTTKASEIGYIKELDNAVIDYGFNCQYFDGKSLDQKKFRDDITNAMLRAESARG